MALFGNGGRARKRVLSAMVTVGALGVFQALALTGATPANAVLAGGCTYNPATQTVTVQQQSGDVTVLGVVNETATPGRSANEIEIVFDTAGGPQDCGSATVTNTTSVVMLGSGVNATNEAFAVDNSNMLGLAYLSGGSFGSIAFSVDMGNNAAPVPPNGDTFAWLGTAGADKVTVTDSTFTANGGKGTVIGTEFLEFDLGAGADTLDASGIAGTAISVDAGAGSDTISTGNGNDNGVAFPAARSFNALGGGYYVQGDSPFLATDTADAANAYNQINTGASRADGQDLYVGGAGFDALNSSSRTAANWLSNDGLPDSGEGTCPGATPVCEGDTISPLIDELVSGSGNDHLVAAAAAGGFTWLNGGPGDDNLDVNNQLGVVLDNTSFTATPTPDLKIDFDAGTQTGNGNDTITHEVPGDSGLFAVGGDGNDTFIFPSNTSVGAPAVNNAGFCGAGGTDLVDASAQTKARTINLTSLSFDGSQNCAVGPSPGSADVTENVTGGSGDDTIVGNGLANSLDGGDGNNTISGNPGNDTMWAGAGNDSFFGGLGVDNVSFKNSPAGETVDESLGFATGGDGSDTFVDYIEILTGSKFGDNIKTGPTGLGSGVNFWVKGLGGKDIITGSNGNDQLAGGGGNDRLLGTGGSDTMLGAAGNDWLYGGPGVDTGDGGKGKDRCIGVEIKTSCGTKSHPKRPTVGSYLKVPGKLL